MKQLIFKFQKQNGYWSRERCEAEAFKYNNRTEFRKNNDSAYVVSGTKGWLDEICKHMNKNK